MSDSLDRLERLYELEPDAAFRIAMNELRRKSFITGLIDLIRPRFARGR